MPVKSWRQLCLKEDEEEWNTWEDEEEALREHCGRLVLVRDEKEKE